MNKETMKQGMIKVLNMYDIPWGNSAIDKIINTWADNKAPLIELLRHHPNWNDEKCYVAFDQNIKGQPDEEKIYNDYQGKTHRCFVCTERLQRTAFGRTNSFFN